MLLKVARPFREGWGLGMGLHWRCQAGVGAAQKLSNRKNFFMKSFCEIFAMANTLKTFGQQKFIDIPRTLPWHPWVSYHRQGLGCSPS